MQNPFETGHIKNYITLYTSVVVIMILFFVATTLFHNVKEVDKKVFAEIKEGSSAKIKQDPKEQEPPQKHFKLLERSYWY